MQKMLILISDILIKLHSSLDNSPSEDIFIFYYSFKLLFQCFYKSFYKIHALGLFFLFVQLCIIKDRYRPSKFFSRSS